jgi:hypothetical protein
MGYSANVYAVDLERLRAAVGSMNLALLQQIKRSQADEFEASDDRFGDAAHSDLTLEQALEELIEGRVSSPACGFQYGYALELLCRGLGKHLTTVGGRELFEDTPLARVRLPDDFPRISYLTAEEVRAELERRPEREAAFAADEGLAEEWEEFAKCLVSARRRKTGIVTFYY